MDIATLVGIIGAIGFVVAAMILGGDPGLFIDTQSLLIVVGGSLFIVMANFPLQQFFATGKVVVKAFFFKIEHPQELIDSAVEMADSARKGGFLALEEAEIPNPFFVKAWICWWTVMTRKWSSTL